MADKAGFLVMYLTEGLTLQQACGSGDSDEEIIPLPPMPPEDNSTDGGSADNSTDGGSADNSTDGNNSTDGGNTDEGSSDNSTDGSSADGG